MKRIFLIITILFISLSTFAQDKTERKTLREWWKGITTEEIHDTVYIFVREYPDIIDDDDEEDIIENENAGAIPIPIDTLNTDEKFQKVILFDNGTWVYYDIPMPDVPDFISDDHWMTNQVHAYNDVNLQDLPDEVELILCDSLHGWHMPGKGAVRSPYKVRKGHKHQGVDLDVEYGDPIYAAFDGIVRVALPSRYTGGYGNVVVLRHANGLETFYGHLTHYTVQADDLVKAGEIIGYCGSTGRSTGPHLHFETRYQGQSFDPERIFDFNNGVLRDSTYTLKKHYFSIYSHEGQTDKESKAASGRVTYTIKKGDTLGAIAKKNGTTVKAICKLNGFKETKVLQIGQKIIVR